MNKPGLLDKRSILLRINTISERLPTTEKEIREIELKVRSAYYHTVNRIAVDSEEHLDKKIQMLDNTISYIEEMKKELKEEKAYKATQYNINQSGTFLTKGGSGLRIASTCPILTIQELREWSMGFLEVKEIKVITSIIIFLFTILFGPASALHWCLIVISLVNFITIKMKRKGKKKASKDIQRNKCIQIFLLPWIYVAILNVISISINEATHKLGISFGFSGAVVFYIGLFIVVLTEIGNAFKNLKEAGIELPVGLETIRNMLLKKLISMLESGGNKVDDESNEKA